ncbi:hypothetical protein NG799_23780 [Laspinema sp. D1]|uniref:Uncharacterized protein n=1 Tax=Laspinema palackyanum D2a TaxID=2953684 RepID=A0ABT2MX53_9CYAN|nr:hypothetical protein [Laspinema sp. D2a]
MKPATSQKKVGIAGYRFLKCQWVNYSPLGVRRSLTATRMTVLGRGVSLLPDWSNLGPLGFGDWRWD